MPFEKYFTSENLIKIVVVFALYAFAAIASYDAGFGSKRSTIYNRQVLPSKHNPPGWVFGMVWAFLYISVAAIWVLEGSKSNTLSYLIFVGLLLNGLWSLCLYAGAHDWIRAKHAHALSTFVLVLLGTVSLYTAWYAYTRLTSNYGRFATVVFFLYFVWMCVAVYLSMTIPPFHEILLRN